MIRELEEPGPDADRLDAERLLLACGFRRTALYGTLVYHHSTGYTFTFGEAQREIPKPYLEQIVDAAKEILEKESSS